MFHRSHDPGFLEIKGGHFEMNTTTQNKFLRQSCKATGQVTYHKFSVWQFYTKDGVRQDFADHTGGHDGRFGHRERGIHSMRR